MDILPERNWGDIIGGSLASSLTTGLSNIASYKLRRIMQGEATEPQPQQRPQVANSPIQQANAQQIQAPQNIVAPQNPYQVHQQIPTQTQQMLSQLQNYGRDQQGMTDPMSMINQTLSGQTGMQQSPFGPSQGMMLGKGAQDLRRLGIPVNPSPAWPQMALPQQQPQVGQPPIQPQVGQTQAGQPQIGQSQVAPQQPMEEQRPYFNMSTAAGREAAANWNKAQAEARKEARADEKMKIEVHKTQQDVVKKIEKNADIAKRDKMIYQNLIDLAQSGELQTGPGYAKLAGLGLGFLFQNPTTQAAKAGMKMLSTGAASAFETNRLTNNEVKAYQDALVSTGNSPAEVIALANSHIYELEAHELKDQAKKAILEANGGYAPKNLKGLIDNMVGDKVAEKFQQASQALKEGTREASRQFTAPGGLGLNIEQMWKMPQGYKFQDQNTGNTIVRDQSALYGFTELPPKEQVPLGSIIDSNNKKFVRVDNTPYGYKEI